MLQIKFSFWIHDPYPESGIGIPDFFGMRSHYLLVADSHRSAGYDNDLKKTMGGFAAAGNASIVHL